MEYLTRRKIVHRDLAARNVLVKNFTHVEVTDFGLAEMLHGAENTVVREGRVAVKWMALESLRSHFYNEKTDVWSFGITCWEIITLGQVPYRDLSLHMDQRLPREMFSHLEKGGRLKQPQNCAFNFYQEIVKCNSIIQHF
jgi:serine/threonine protein kinase